MSYVSSRSMAGIVCRTLDHVDERLISHGKRVSYIVMKMLKESGAQEARALRDACLTAMIHDIGAYKTEEINNMVRFETSEVWEHSVYGYVFVKNLSPLKEYAPAILFHHAPYEKLRKLEVPHRELAQMIRLADRIDIYKFSERQKDVIERAEQAKDLLCAADIVDLFLRAEEKENILKKLESDDFWEEVLESIDASPFTTEEIETYLKMLIYTIDFRSKYTVIHTITTTRISMALGKLFALPEEDVEKIRYGALLHDLGKIGIPVEILEFSGKLSPQAMRVMRSHVNITEQILGGEIEETVTRIALRHHEKLDGSGYPRGLTAGMLTLSERIVALADMISALTGKRSYKEAFERDKVLGLLRREREAGQFCPEVADKVIANYDAIMENVRLDCEPVLRVYNSVGRQYRELMEQCKRL